VNLEVMMCKTIKQRVRFNASPATIYDLLADSRKHSAVTGRKATISRKVGGRFSASGDDVSGIIVDLVPGQRIVQAWRHVPKELIPETERTWREQYWLRIKTFLATP
jgi:uncharacterized protein YndB with AHSA1/START domain